MIDMVAVFLVLCGYCVGMHRPDVPFGMTRCAERAVVVVLMAQMCRSWTSFTFWRLAR